MNQNNKTGQDNKQAKKQEDFSKKLKEITKELKLLLADLLINREITEEERNKKGLIIESYLQMTGGTIIAISCKDGILLFGVNPEGKRNIFRIFHRIGLLAIGKTSDYEDIHLRGLISVLSRWLNRSRADIDTREITDEIAQLIEENFNYFKSERKTGSYKANFIISKLGFDIDDDFISAIDFEGTKSSDKGTVKCNYAIIEMPLVMMVPVKEREFKKPADDKKDGKTGLEFKEKTELRPKFLYPISEVLELLANIIYSQDDIWTIREVAFFIGSIVFFFNDLNKGFVEAEYLDRNMLKKTELGDRRFHHIWNSITTPNPYKKSDPYQNWKKFTAPVRKEIKKGEKYPSGLQLLSELLDVLYGKKVKNEKEKELLEKIGKQGVTELLINTLKRMKNKK